MIPNKALLEIVWQGLWDRQNSDMGLCRFKGRFHLGNCWGKGEGMRAKVSRNTDHILFFFLTSQH